jgi:5-hydroxyisourate hydrolase-like protein (transthyretin family)
MFNLILVAQSKNHQDCSTSFDICALKTYHFADISGYGTTKEKSTNEQCFTSGFEETNAHWISWDVEKGGTITFVINPNNEKDDVDFILYKKDNNGCTSMREVRCMATGNNIGENPDGQRNCQGPTGLTINAIDEFESSGCKLSSDNFLKMIKVEQGEC